MSTTAEGPSDPASVRQFQERMDAISTILAGIHRRLDAVEARLAHLEWQRGVAPPRVERSVPAPEPLPVEAPAPPPPAAEPPPTVEAEPAAVEPPAAVEAPPLIETRMGLTWVNRIGVVTLLLGAAFGFKYAVDNQWVGPGGRVVLGVLAGLASLFIGERLWTRGQKIFAQGMTGMGVALAYLSFFASFGLYHLVPQAMAFVLMMTVTAAAGALSMRYGSLAVAILGLLGGYATPVLLSTGQDAPWILFSYVALLNLGSTWVSRKQRWPSLAVVAFAATSVLFASWMAEHYKPEKAFVATLFVFVFHAQFAAMGIPALFAAAHVACAVALTGTVRGPLQNTLSGELGLLGLGLGFALWLDFPFVLSLGVGAWWLAYVAPGSGTVPVDRLPMFYVLSAQAVAVLAWLVWRSRWRPALAAELIAAGANAAAYYAASYYLLHGTHQGWLGLLAVAVGALHLAAAWVLRKDITESLESQTPALFAAAVALGFLTLAVPVQLSGFSITMAWAVEMAALAWLATRVREERFRWTVWCLAALVLWRLVAFDSIGIADNAPLLLNGRFAAYFLAAAGYALAAWWLRPRQDAGVLYVLAHSVMLWNLTREAMEWADRAAILESRSNAVTLSASGVMALYALALVTAGVLTRTVLNRILGLVLFAVVIAKLYLSDVWQLRLIYRVTAFLGLGGMLILASYFYSRFRGRVESFWKHEQTPAP